MVFKKTMVLHPRIQAYLDNLENEGSKRTHSSSLNIFQKFTESKYKTLDILLDDKILKKKVNLYDLLIEFKNCPTPNTDLLQLEIYEIWKTKRITSIQNIIDICSNKRRYSDPNKSKKICHQY
jgi:hypothetical protein